MSNNIQELLPFYVNGTLSDEEKSLVEQAITDDPSLRQEITYLGSLRDGLQEMEAEISPGELGLKRLQKILAAQSDESDLISKTMSKTAPEQNNRIWRMVAMAACLLLVVQTVVTLPEWQKGGDLDAASGGQSMFISGKILSVTFVPQSREESIRGLLLSVNARIVDGPSALGVYKLAITGDVASVVDKLAAHKNLIETVQLENSN